MTRRGTRVVQYVVTEWAYYGWRVADASNWVNLDNNRATSSIKEALSVSKPSSTPGFKVSILVCAIRCAFVLALRKKRS